MSDEITTPEAQGAPRGHKCRWCNRCQVCGVYEAHIHRRPDRPSDLDVEVVVKGRCPEHHLTYCEPCGWITVAEVGRLREAAAVAEQYAGIAHEQRDTARADWRALRTGIESLRDAAEMGAVAPDELVDRINYLLAGREANGR